MNPATLMSTIPALLRALTHTVHWVCNTACLLRIPEARAFIART